MHFTGSSELASKHFSISFFFMFPDRDLNHHTSHKAVFIPARAHFIVGGNFFFTFSIDSASVCVGVFLCEFDVSMRP